MECSCKLCPMPGIYEVTSIPFVKRTRATLRNAELGFFGVVVYTRVHTPRRCGHLCRAGLDVLAVTRLRPFLTSWLTVGKKYLYNRFRVRPPQAKLPPNHESGGGQGQEQP